MRRSQSTEELLFDPEIERSLRQLRRERRAVERVFESTMAEENEHNDRAMKDYLAPTLEGCSSSIVRPPVQANNFELKTSLIQFVQQNCQFARLLNEDPNEHFNNFLEICGTIKINSAMGDAIRLRLFHFSLRDKARAWLKSLSQGTLTTWGMVARKF